MKQEPLVLTFDMGTQSARAMLVNAQGEIVAKKQKQYEQPYFSLHPGWAEQKPEFYWNAVCETSRSLKADNEAYWKDIVAVTCTTIRDTCLCVDKDGNPLRDVILWLDKREATELGELPFVNSLLFSLVQQKNAVEVIRAQSACNWIAKNEKEIWDKTWKFIFLSAYFTFKFCNNLVDSSANIIGHIPFDVKNRIWAKPNDIKRSVFSLTDDKFCDLVEPGETMGTITAQASQETGIPEGLPVIASGADKGCETLALTCLHEDSAALSFGTIATIEISTDQYFEATPFIPPFPAVLKKFNPEVEIYRGYWLVSWFKKEFAALETLRAQELGVSVEKLLDEQLDNIPPGCDGLLLQPTFTPGATQPHARGVMIGFSEIHTRMHIYRAIIEGINYGLMEGMYLMEKKGKLKVGKLFVAGGGAQSPQVCQITANMFGLPVYRIHTHEACGVGSSLVAFKANGTFDSYEEAAKAMVHIKDEFQPDMKVHQIYKDIYNRVYSKLFGSLAQYYKDIDDMFLRA